MRRHIRTNSFSYPECLIKEKSVFKPLSMFSGRKYLILKMTKSIEETGMLFKNANQHFELSSSPQVTRQRESSVQLKVVFHQTRTFSSVDVDFSSFQMNCKRPYFTRKTGEGSCLLYLNPIFVFQK